MIQSNTPASAPPRPRLAAVAIVGVLVLLAIGVGTALSWAAGPAPAGAFSACRPAPRTGPHAYAAAPGMCIDPKRNYSATITTTKGDIGVVFLASSTPRTVNNFIVLAVNGYFTGQSFFRSADWYVQSGDPTATGRGGPGYLLPDEPSSDRWTPGSLGMARLGDQGLSGSQFFITKNDFPGGVPGTVYNHFATVTLGFDLLQQLGPDDRILKVTVRRD